MNKEILKHLHYLKIAAYDRLLLFARSQNKPTHILDKTDNEEIENLQNAYCWVIGYLAVQEITNG